MKNLSVKQEQFCQAYVSNGHNATQAAITAGYSEKTTHSSGPRLLDHVGIKARLAELEREVIDKASAIRDDRIASAAEVLAELSDIGMNREGELGAIEIRASDKTRALDLMARHHGLLVERVEVTTNIADTLRQRRRRMVDGGE